MPFFRKKTKSPSASPAFRSVEHLPDSPLVAGSTYRHPAHSQSQSPSPPASSPSLLHRSQSHRHPNPNPHSSHHTPVTLNPNINIDISASNNSSSSSVALPPSPAPPRFDADPPDQSPDDQHQHQQQLQAQSQNPRRSKRSLFSLHSSSTTASPRESGLERNRSVRKSSPVASRHPQRPLSVDTDHPPPHPASRSREYVVDSLRSTPQSPMPQITPSSIQRSNTDPSLLDIVHRPSPTESRQQQPLPPPPDLAQQQQPSLDPRPPSRQSIGPPSPLRPLPYTEPTPSGMSERPTTGGPGGQSAHSPYPAQDPTTGFRNGNQEGRSTPTSNRSRDENEVDVRSLIQKHDELQAKYSKVKRYYFEKEAQVQHLQNTVAHQRMAVSRTVLDDNEYANRFGRLDGAIKDLAFAVRKDWKTLPSWLTGFVNDDAHTTGTKEMTAIGRAVMSRWLVDELFERYFHPALEPGLSRSLKAIEVTLRRQQGKNYTSDEDKENAIARISNWRRTTLDGLVDVLHAPAAEDHRVQLIDRLVTGLVGTLTTHLCDPPPPGLDNGARMIIENAVGIADKIPLESRDICVDYILPGTVLHDQTMKIETGIPPLTNVSEASAAAARASDDRPDAPEDIVVDDSSSGSNQEPGAVPREQRKRSVFSSLMGRRGQGQGQAGQAPMGVAGAGTGGTADAGRPAAAEQGPARVRFATFVMADVKGRGPVNVLVKAPVYVE